MTLLRRVLRDRRRAFLWWAFGLTVLVVVNLAFYPTIKGNTSYDDLFKDMPETLRAMMGDVDGIALTSPAGYLNSQMYALMIPMILLVYAIGVGSSVIAGAEEDGTLELVLAEPVSRRRVIVERCAAFLVLLALLDLVALVATVVPAPALGLLDGVGVAHLIGVTLVMFAIVVLHAALAFAVACATGRKAVAQGVAGGVAVLGYVAYGLERSVSWLRPLRAVTPWHWYLQHNWAARAPDALSLLPLALALIVLVAGVLAFERRDLRLP